MSASSNPSYIAGGNIRPSRFIKLSTSADHTVLEATAGSDAIGVSSEALRSAPYPDVTVTYAAIAGDPVSYYGPGEPCEIVAGESITRGAYLVPGSEGKAFNAEDDSQYFAIARASAATGEKCKVQLVRGYKPAAST